MNKDSWEVKMIGEVFDLYMGRTPSRSNPMYWGDNTGYKWVSISDIGNEKYIQTTKEFISELGKKESKIKVVPKGTVIMSFKLSIGKVAITAEDMYTNEAIMAFHPINSSIFEQNYIYYYLKGYDWIGSNRAVMGTTLNKFSISNSKIVIPPIAIQEQIVKELDTLCDIITKKKEQLAELDKLAQATFYDMFGDPVENEIKWERKKLGDLCNIVRGGSPRPISNYLGGNIPWIKIGDASKGNNIYLHSTQEHIISDGVKKSRLIPAGSLIFANCGVSLGFARIITFDGCIHDGWLAFNKISETLNEIFLLKLINVQTDYLRASAPDGTQPNLNTTIMKNFPIILPPISLQNQFAEKIEAIEQQKALINQSITDTQLLFDYTMDKYFN